MKPLCLSWIALLALVLLTPLAAGAQWRATAWTMDLQNDTDNCISLTAGADGDPKPMYQRDVWAHHSQHFDDNHTQLSVHVKVYGNGTCSGPFVADLHDNIHQLRNILTVTKTGSTFALARKPTEDMPIPHVETSVSSLSGQDGPTIQTGASYSTQGFAVAKIHLGDDVRSVMAIAATNTAVTHENVPCKAAGKSCTAWVHFTTRDGAGVTVNFREEFPVRPGSMRAWKVAYQAPTATIASAAQFASATMARYGQKPSTQSSGAAITLQYCMLQKGANNAPAGCSEEAPLLEVLAAVPQSHIELKNESYLHPRAKTPS
jgi:hypothetical protein